MAKKTTAAVAHQHRRDDDEFPDLASMVRKHLSPYANHPLFVVETKVPLYTMWLEGFEDAKQRQIHDCHECRRFIERYGSVVAIDEDGTHRSVLWDPLGVSDLYQPAIEAIRHAVQLAPVVGVFLSNAKVWGTPETPDPKRGITWEHFSAASPAVFKHPLLSAEQKAAEIREERGMLARALAEFPEKAVMQAKALLETDQLYRSEKCLGVATWLLGLHDLVGGTKNAQRRENLLWKAAATAPAGFCHVRSTMIGTLLEDIAAGKAFDDVARSFASKMHPLQYQRPTAPPSDANIAQAEKVMEQLATAHALDRRFARLEDLELVWRPLARQEKAPGGIFGHLKTAKPQAEQIGGRVTMTWEKFARQVLPTAEQIEMNVPAIGAFIALVTAEHPEAPPILQWDREDRRNPVSWYVMQGGSTARRFNLESGWRPLSGITLLPPMWNGGHAHHGDGVILLLQGARDVEHRSSGGFFVEQLKSEYHAIRRTLEAHMMSAKISGKEEASAAGYDLRKGASWNTLVRVTVGAIVTTYLLDRWD